MAWILGAPQTAGALARGSGATAHLHLLALPDFSIHLYWYLGRSAGFVAFWLLFASVAMGLAVSSRVFDGMLARPWVFEFHKFLSVFVLVVMIFHGLIMLPDPYIKFRLSELLIPFRSHYKNTPMAIGIMTLYGSVLMTVSFYMKGIIGQKGWRTLHYLTFLTFVGALAHGLWSGTDTKSQYAQYSYLAAGSGVMFLSFFRIFASRSIAKKARAATAPVRAQAEQVATARAEQAA
jgi:predicted ferric reductase